MKIVHKYIIVDGGVILFTEHTTHLIVGAGTKECKRTIYSAGFVVLAFNEKDEVIASPYGESESLKIKSHPEQDKIVIEDFFKGVNSLIRYNLLIVKDLYKI